MNDRAYWLALSGVTGIGPARFAALLEHFETPEQIWHAPPETLQPYLDKRTFNNLLADRRTVDPHQLLIRLQRSGADTLCWDDPGYPSNLRATDHAAPVLYVAGRLTVEDQTAVAIVGTRRASPYGREIAHRLATELARNRVTVVSGLALGIDTVAHQAAVDAGGRTIAVLGSGVDLVYPAQNRRLAHAIVRHGALVSDYPLGTKPEPRNFPPRNRIISGLSCCVAIVEAGERSGALITAGFAAEQGRDVFAVPGSIYHPGSAGCNRLIQQGAAPLLAVDDILDALHLDARREHESARQALPDDPLERRVLTSLTLTPTHFDDLARASALEPAQVGSVLAMLELKGLVRQVTPQCFVRV